MKKIFFFGELPPKTIHGASVSNKINVDFLKEKFLIDIVEEFSDLKFHNKFSLLKLSVFIKSVLLAWNKMLFVKYDYFYGVVYISTLGLLKNIFLLFFFRLTNKNSKAILHFHRSDLNTQLRKKHISLLFKIFKNFVDEFIVLSLSQKKELTLLFSGQVNVLYNTIEENGFDIPKVKNKAPLKLLYLSNYIREKGIVELIDAFKELGVEYPGKYILNCYGNFSTDEVREEILRKSEGVSNLTINDSVYEINKQNVILEHDLVILPSYNEGLPITLLESLYYKKPIIITKVGYIEEVLGKEYPLYCSTKNVSSIKEKIILYDENIRMDDEFNLFLENLYEKFNNKNHKEQLFKIFK